MRLRQRPRPVYESDAEVRARLRAAHDLRMKDLYAAFALLAQSFADVHARRPRFDPRRLGDRYVVWRITRVEADVRWPKERPAPRRGGNAER